MSFIYSILKVLYNEQNWSHGDTNISSLGYKRHGDDKVFVIDKVSLAYYHSVLPKTVRHANND